MIDLRERPEAGWNVLFGVSLAAILGLIWFIVASPYRPAASTFDRDEEVQTGTALRFGSSETVDKARIDKLTWSPPAEALGPPVLDNLTAVAQKHSVQLTSFRTDKTNLVAGLEEAPFVVTVEGAFPDVVAFANAVEDPGGKLAVNLVELSASDTAPGRVTATFGLLGFLMKETK